jgi:hypothetical protein
MNENERETPEAVLDALRASQKALKLMALNDARIIGKLKQDARDAVYWKERAKIAEGEMKIARKHERDVFKLMSVNCQVIWAPCVGKPNGKCVLGKCPLLEQKEEVK